MQSLILLFCCLFLAVSTVAQTLTATDVNGQSIVEVLTLNAAGLPTTEIVSTLPTTTPTITPTTTPTTTPALTIANGQQGPVGQPPVTTGPAPPTVYQYTTTNAAGETIAVQDTFTPTYVQSLPLSATASGTILAFSQWLSLVGTNTAPASDASLRFHLSTSWLAIVSGLVSCFVGGAYHVFL